MMRSWRLWLGLVAIILSAAFVGGIGAMYYLHHSLPSLDSGGPGLREQLVLSRMFRILELDNDQQKMAREIFEGAQREMMASRERFHREGAEIWGRAQERLKPFLTPEQLSRLERLDKRMKRRFEPGHFKGPRRFFGKPEGMFGGMGPQGLPGDSPEDAQ